MRSRTLFTTIVTLVATGVGVSSGVSAPGPSPQAVSMSVDTLEASRLRMMQEVLASIAGRESEPAESVFKNIKVLTGVPAGRVPAMMNFGFGKSLGVGCTHCHVTADFSRDDSTTKGIAREMFTMARRINTELLQEIDGVADRRPVVNCTTCHRGATRPATEMP